MLVTLWSIMTGLAVGIFPAEQLLHHRGFSQSNPERLIALVVVATVIAFIVLSVFLYLGRLWARRALATALFCFILAMLAFIAFRDWPASHDITRITVYIIVLAPPLFVLGVLFQPDVVRAFPPRRPSGAGENSNQSAATDVLARGSSTGLVKPQMRRKKFLIVLGAIFLMLILLGAIGIGIVAIKGAALDKESKAYVDAAVPAIVSSWKTQELLSRASPELKQATKTDDLERFFQAFRSLGKMRKYQGSQGQSVISRILGKGTTISADYLVRVEFEGGTAKIYVKLIKHGNLWQIGGFHVEPTSNRRLPSQAMHRTPKKFAGALQG
jgi:MFS family permease